MKKYIKWILICLGSMALFYVATVPTRDLFSVFTVSEVRPAAVVNPILGFCFGIPGALGCALANSIADYTSGYSWTVILEGFIPQFLYGYLPFLLWHYVTKGETHTYRINNISRTVKFTLIMLFNSLLIGLFVGLIIWSNFGVSIIDAGFFVFVNDFIFSMLLGFPLAVVINRIWSRVVNKESHPITSCEKHILISFGVQMLALVIVIISVYSHFNGLDVEVYDIWNKIYTDFLIVLAAIMFATFISIVLTNNNEECKTINVI